MNGLQECRFAKTVAPNANWGRQLGQVGVPGHSCENRRSRSSPIRAAKNWKQKMMKPQVLRGTAAFVAEMLLRTPIPATPFFDVGLRKSIAAGISAGQAGWAACFHMSYWVTRARLLILNFDQVCFVASSCASFFSIHASNFLPSDTDTSLYSCSKIFMQSSIYS